MASSGPSWNSSTLHALYESLGWLGFAAWSLSFYPQAILNYTRRSVTGLNFDFVVLNLTKHVSYLIFNASLFFSSVVQAQYREKFGPHELIPVSASDVAFSIHAVTLTAFTALQIAIYDRGSQRISGTCKLITIAVWLLMLGCIIFATLTSSWLWLVTMFNYLQVVMTSIKYIPQAWFNIVRRSTAGWSIGNVLLDITGGATSFAMMLLQSLDQSSFANFEGNVGKLLLSAETVGFDVLFILQHYVFYRQAAHAHATLRKQATPPGSESDVPLLAAGADGAGNIGVDCESASTSNGLS